MKRFIDSTRLIVNINDENFENFMKMADIMKLKTIIIDGDDVLSIDGQPVETDKRVYVEDVYQVDPDIDEQASVKTTEPEMILPTMADGAQDQAIEPENIGRVAINQHSDPFVRAQISTKNQMILRNILAVLSSLGVVIVFILEKLGIM